jgi:proline iminopeptidase
MFTILPLIKNLPDMYFKRKILLQALIAIFFFSCKKEKFINDPGNLVPLTVDQNSSLPSIFVKGALLHSEAFGNPDSTMIVCIHGGPGSDYRYMLNCKQLASYGYKVVFYDQRGSGLSQRLPKSSYSNPGSAILDTLYDELSGVIAYYRTSAKQKVFLLGHSWGGILATGYAGKHPADIQGLAVYEPGGFKWDDITSYVNKSRSFSLWSESLNNAAYIDQFITGKEHEHQVLDYKLSLLASTNDITGESNLDPDTHWRSGAIINAALLEMGKKYKPDFSAGLNQFKVPVLFFYSEKNKAYPDSWAQTIGGSFSSSSLIKLMGTGHSGMIADKKIWTEKTLPALLNYFRSR